jgi:hypothetical protein
MLNPGPRASIAYKLAIVAAAFVFGCGVRICAAQSLDGLKIGDSSTTLSHLGPPAETSSYKGMAVRRWDLPNGNSLSVTVGRSGRIVYLESDWNGNDDDPVCDLPALHFGRTTLNELRKRLGSNGFTYETRGPGIQTPDGVVMLNSYDVGTVVVTFYTKVNRDEYVRAKASAANASPADYAKLDGISIADDGYARSEWGSRVSDSAYKKPEWK